MTKDKYKYFVDKIRNGDIKISTKCLSMKLDCSKEIRKKCGGACCKGHNEIMLPEFSCGEEIKKEIEKELENKKVKFNLNGECNLIDYCLKDGSGRPLECKLAPLGFNKSGRLITKRWAWLRPCPAYGKGKPIYIAMKDCLIEVFGEEIYKKIVMMIEVYKVDNLIINKKL